MGDMVSIRIRDIILWEVNRMFVNYISIWDRVCTEAQLSIRYSIIHKLQEDLEG